MLKPIRQSMKSVKRQFLQYFDRLSTPRVKLGDAVYALRKNYQNPLVSFLKLRAGREYEAEFKSVLKRVFRLRKGAFIDVGANVGQTLLNVLEIEKDREYIGFEPQVSGCLFIDAIIKENDLQGKTILPLGLSNRIAIEKLKFNSQNDAAASFVDEYRPADFYKGFAHILTLPGDRALEMLGRPEVGILKIDVEGAELEVIEGFALTIEKDKPYIFFELLPHFLFLTKKTLDPEVRRVRDARHASIMRLLSDADYRVYKIKGGPEVQSVDELVADTKEKFDYVAVPETEAEKFRSQFSA